MLSIIVMTRNEEARIGRMLRSIVAEEFKDPYEVIIVDANSQDNTRNVASSFSDRLPLRIVLGLGKGIGADRNLGGSISNGDLLFFTEGDCFLKKGLLEKIVELFEDPNLKVWSSIALPNCHSWLINFTYKVYDFMRKVLSHLPYPFKGYSISGASIVIRKPIFLKVGGFQEGGMMNDDGRLGRKIRNYCRGRRQFLFSLDQGFAVYRSMDRFEKNYFQALNHYVYVWVNFFPFLHPLLKNQMVVEGRRFRTENE